MQAHRIPTAASNLSGHRGGLGFGIAVMEGYAGALARQPHSDGAADTTAGAGYQRHLALEWFHCQDAPSFRPRETISRGQHTTPEHFKRAATKTRIDLAITRRPDET